MFYANGSGAQLNYRKYQNWYSTSFTQRKYQNCLRYSTYFTQKEVPKLVLHVFYTKRSTKLVHYVRILHTKNTAFPESKLAVPHWLIF
jgi:hypothetical protein